jgi:hypothetical protein
MGNEYGAIVYVIFPIYWGTLSPSFPIDSLVAHPRAAYPGMN